MFYIKDDEKIILYDTSEERLKQTLDFMPEYSNFQIHYTDKNIVNFEGNFYFEEDIQEKIEEQEKEAIGQLSLTKREVFLAIYNDKGITPEEIRAQITDQSALIEFDYAEKYYRGNPLIDILGQALGYTKERLDYLFENKSF